MADSLLGDYLGKYTEDKCQQEQGPLPLTRGGGGGGGQQRHADGGPITDVAKKASQGQSSPAGETLLADFTGMCVSESSEICVRLLLPLPSPTLTPRGQMLTSSNLRKGRENKGKPRKRQQTVEGGE